VSYPEEEAASVKEKPDAALANDKNEDVEERPRRDHR
jgi:hypothetical protein